MLFLILIYNNNYLHKYEVIPIANTINGSIFTDASKRRILSLVLSIKHQTTFFVSTSTQFFILGLAYLFSICKIHSPFMFLLQGLDFNFSGIYTFKYKNQNLNINI